MYYIQRYINVFFSSFILFFSRLEINFACHQEPTVFSPFHFKTVQRVLSVLSELKSIKKREIKEIFGETSYSDLWLVI